MSLISGSVCALSDVRYSLTSPMRGMTTRLHAVFMHKTP